MSSKTLTTDTSLYFQAHGTPVLMLPEWQQFLQHHNYNMPLLPTTEEKNTLTNVTKGVGGDLGGALPNPDVLGLSGTPMTLEGTTERIFRSRMAHTGTTITPVSGTAYFIFIGKTVNPLTPQFVEFYPTAVGSGLTSIEVGLFSSPTVPTTEVTQTLTALVSGVAAIPLHAKIPAHNTTAFSTLIYPGTNLWAGVLISESGGSMPTLQSLVADWNNGYMETSDTASTFATTSSYAATIPQDTGAVAVPEIRVLLDAVVDPVIPFDPSQITGLTTWLDPTTITGLSDGDPVVSIVDKSTNGYTYTPSGTVTYKVNQINGLPVMRFSSSQLLSTSELASTWFDGTFNGTGYNGNGTVIVIVRQTSGAALMTLYGSLGGGDEYFVYSNYGGTFLAYWGSGTIGVIQPSNWTDGNFHIFQFDSTYPTINEKRLFADNTLLATTTSNPFNGTSSAQMDIGTDGYGTYLVGDVALVLTYNKLLSSAEMTQLYSWITTVYGI